MGKSGRKREEGRVCWNGGKGNCSRVYRNGEGEIERGNSGRENGKKEYQVEKRGKIRHGANRRGRGNRQGMKEW